MDVRMSDYLNEMSSAVESFPDLNIIWKNIHQLEPGKVEIGYFQITGTHTGKPYGFDPYPEVAPEGHKVLTDPEKIIFETNDGKFSKITYIASSDLSGLPGIYRQIGGFPM